MIITAEPKTFKEQREQYYNGVRPTAIAKYFKEAKICDCPNCQYSMKMEISPEFVLKGFKVKEVKIKCMSCDKEKVFTPVGDESLIGEDFRPF